MADETDYLGRDVIESESYLEPTSYKVKFRCKRCGHRYSRTYKSIPKGNAPCPKKACKEAIAAEQAQKEEQNVAAMIETGKTPGHVGANNMVKAIDMTADIVMEDHKMSDLKDNTRMGDSMVPGLTPRQQKMSENFWGGGRQRDKRKPTYMPGVNMRGTIDKAMQGQFLPNIAATVPRDTVTGDNLLTDLHSRKYKPPVEIIFDANKGKKQ